MHGSVWGTSVLWVSSSTSIVLVCDFVQPWLGNISSFCVGSGQGKTVMWRRQSENQGIQSEKFYFLGFYETWKLYMTTLTMSVRRNEVPFTVASLLGQSILHLCFIASHEFQCEMVDNWMFRFFVVCVKLWFSLMSKGILFFWYLMH